MLGEHHLCGGDQEAVDPGWDEVRYNIIYIMRNSMSAIAVVYS